jgi:hypothetical protein
MRIIFSTLTIIIWLWIFQYSTFNRIEITVGSSELNEKNRQIKLIDNIYVWFERRCNLWVLYLDLVGGAITDGSLCDGDSI